MQIRRGPVRYPLSRVQAEHYSGKCEIFSEACACESRQRTGLAFKS